MKKSLLIASIIFLLLFISPVLADTSISYSGTPIWDNNKKTICRTTNNIFVIWKFGSTRGDMAVSTNNGASFTTTYSFINANLPSILCDGSNVLALGAYGGNTVRYRNSSNEGTNWSSEYIFTPPTGFANDVVGVFKDGRIYIAYHDGVHNYFARSSDLGVTWDLNKTDIAGSTGFTSETTSICMSGVGDNSDKIHYVGKSGSNIIYANSTNGGQNWTYRTLVSNIGSGADVACSGSNVFVSFTNTTHAYVINSTNDGVTWSSPTEVDGLSSDYIAGVPSLSTNYKGNVIAAWSENTSTSSGNWVFVYRKFDGYWRPKVNLTDPSSNMVYYNAIESLAKATDRLDFMYSNSLYYGYSYPDCLTPTGDNNIVNESTMICDGTYYINDTNGDGVFQINASDIELNCSNAIFIGDNAANSRFLNFSGAKTGVNITKCNVTNYKAFLLAGGYGSDYGMRVKTLSYNELHNISNGISAYMENVLFNKFYSSDGVNSVGVTKNMSFNYFNSSGAQISGVNNVRFDNNEMYYGGVYFYYSSGFGFSNNIIKYSAGWGVDTELPAGPSFAISTNNTITNNYGGYRTAGSGGANMQNLWNSTIINNTYDLQLWQLDGDGVVYNVTYNPNNVTFQPWYNRPLHYYGYVVGNVTDASGNPINNVTFQYYNYAGGLVMNNQTDAGGLTAGKWVELWIQNATKVYHVDDYLNRPFYNVIARSRPNYVKAVKFVTPSFGTHYAGITLRNCAIPTANYMMDENGHIPVCYGVYYLNGTSSVFDVNVSNVTLNCNNSQFIGNNLGTFAYLYSGVYGVNITNCSLTNYSYSVDGGYNDGAGDRASRVYHFTNNTLRNAPYAMFMGDRASFDYNHIYDTTVYGFWHGLFGSWDTWNRDNLTIAYNYLNNSNIFVTCLRSYSSALGDSLQCLINNNEIYNSPTNSISLGRKTWGLGYPAIAQFNNNIINNGTTCGIYIYPTTPGGTYSYILASNNNTITNNTYCGIGTENSGQPMYWGGFYNSTVKGDVWDTDIYRGTLHLVNVTTNGKERAAASGEVFRDWYNYRIQVYGWNGTIQGAGVFIYGGPYNYSIGPTDSGGNASASVMTQYFVNASGRYNSSVMASKPGWQTRINTTNIITNGVSESIKLRMFANAYIYFNGLLGERDFPSHSWVNTTTSLPDMTNVTVYLDGVLKTLPDYTLYDNADYNWTTVFTQNDNFVGSGMTAMLHIGRYRGVLYASVVLLPFIIAVALVINFIRMFISGDYSIEKFIGYFIILLIAMAFVGILWSLI